MREITTIQSKIVLKLMMINIVQTEILWFSDYEFIPDLCCLIVTGICKQGLNFTDGHTIMGEKLRS